MSEAKDEIIPSNEEIIDDLTKDLRDSQFTVGSDGDKPYIPSENEDSDEERERKPIVKDPEESDYEEELKTRDLTLTDEEKETKRSEAVELKKRGNDEFRSEKYLESIGTYTEALHLCPLKYGEDRAMIFANRAASKSKIERKVSAIHDCSKAIELNETYLRAYVRRAKLYEDTDKLDESLEDYKKILELDPGNKDALHAQYRLPPLIQERNEKLKTEMFGKLKDLGNVLLRPFGLSTNNFQMQQDPSTGGYSINFQQNPNE